MNAIFILLLIIVSLILFWYLYKISKARAYISNIRTKYPIQVSTFCGTDIGYLDSSVRKKIQSQSLEVWTDWANKIDLLTSCSNSFPKVISEYILYYFPNVKNVPRYKDYKIFDPVVKRCKILIECLQYDDILKLCQISRDEWSRRQKIKSKADTIILSNPDAIKELRNKDSSLLDEDIIRLRKRIEQIQQRYNIASAFDAWIPTQEEFNSKVRNLRDEHAKNCGCYKYDIEFKKPLSSGKTSSDKYTVWQIFPNSYSPFLQEYHSSLAFSMQDNIPEFKSRTRFYLNSMYDKIIPYIRAVSSDKQILVVFNYSTSYKWSKETYNYHYKYLKSVLDKENIPYVNWDNLLSLIDGFNYDIVLVFDIFTNNQDLIYTSKILIETFDTKIPNIFWYSMIKEYDEKEMKEICAEAIKKAKEKKEKDDSEKDKAVAFIKQQLLAVNRNSFFSYYAIPNTLIGEAANSSMVKPVWLSSPANILVESTDKNNKKTGYISVRYSIDGGLSWTSFEKAADYKNIDDVTLFTYELFKAMGVLNDFITKGSKAISFINAHQYLAHR